MLEKAERGDQVWAVIDSEVVPCRFVKFDGDESDPTRGVVMTYVEQDKWGKHQRTSDARLVFPKNQQAAAKKLANGDTTLPEIYPPPIRSSYTAQELKVGDKIHSYDDKVYKIVKIIPSMLATIPYLTLEGPNGERVEHDCSLSPNSQYRLINR